MELVKYLYSPVEGVTSGGRVATLSGGDTVASSPSRVRVVGICRGRSNEGDVKIVSHS